MLFYIVVGFCLLREYKGKLSFIMLIFLCTVISKLKTLNEKNNGPVNQAIFKYGLDQFTCDNFLNYHNNCLEKRHVVDLNKRGFKRTFGI